MVLLIKIFLILSCFCVSAVFANDDASHIENWYAKQFNISPNKAKTRITIGLDAREFANALDLQDKVSGGMYIQNSPNFKVIFNVKRASGCKGEYDHNAKLCSDFERGIRNKIHKEGWQYFATINRVDNSLLDLNKVQIKVQEILKKFVTEEAKLITRIEDGSMTLKIVNSAKFIQKLLSNKVNLPMQIKVEELRLPPKLSAIFGGADVNGFCTFGFIVKDSKGVKGVSTAEHCGENASWAGTKLKHRGRLMSRDTQWFEFPHDLQAEAKSNIVSHISNGQLSIKSLAGTTVLGAGNPVCMFGAEGGRKCGIVFAVNQILAEKNLARRNISHFDNLTIVTTNGKEDGGGLSVAGDSGGPYYLFDKAVGQVVAGDETSSYYTPISNVTALGVSILTR